MAAAPNDRNDRNDRYSSDYQYDAPNVLTAATDPVPVSIPLDALYSSLNSIEAQRSDNNNNKKKMEKMKKSKEIQKQKNHFNTISDWETVIGRWIWQWLHTKDAIWKINLLARFRASFALLFSSLMVTSLLRLFIKAPSDGGQSSLSNRPTPTPTLTPTHDFNESANSFSHCLFI